MYRKMLLVALFAVASSANAQGVTCGLGLYNKYVVGTGVVADAKPVVQGNCTWTAANGFYVDGWFSQSLRDPGRDARFGNEFDVTIGHAGKIGERWSYDAHLAYYDLANPRVFAGTNGDLVNSGGTLRYHASGKTSVYANVEYYDGIGSRGLKAGWRTGIGGRTVLGPVVVDAVHYTVNFLGHGRIVKLSLEPDKPIAKIGNGEIRPVLMYYQPIGRYRLTHDDQVVVGIRVNF